mmetsp:Transcript_11577/g.31029  ORF Transcript_11577/g.31029 Transcript_11577/m.31029 type:complete len:135 (+) Transcript_11577:1328-1732(+)
MSISHPDSTLENFLLFWRSSILVGLDSRWLTIEGKTRKRREVEKARKREGWFFSIDAAQCWIGETGRKVKRVDEWMRHTYLPSFPSSSIRMSYVCVCVYACTCVFACVCVYANNVYKWMNQQKKRRCAPFPAII